MTLDVCEKITEVFKIYLSDADSPIVIDRFQPLVELGLDSLSILEIIYELEECFGAELSELQLRKLTTIDDLIHAFGGPMTRKLSS